MADQYAVPRDPFNISADGAMIIDNPSRAQNYAYTITINPVYSDTATDTDLGLIGLLISGAAPTDLDACNGHLGPTPKFPNGIYHHLVETGVYSIPCYHGVVTTPG